MLALLGNTSDLFATYEPKKTRNSVTVYLARQPRVRRFMFGSLIESPTLSRSGLPRPGLSGLELLLLRSRRLSACAVPVAA